MPPVNMIDPATGKTFAVEPDDVARMQRGGWAVEAADTAAERLTNEQLEEDYGGVTGTITAGLAAGARGVSGGLSDAVISAAGGGRDLRRLRDINPGASMAGEIVGGVGGALLGVGVAGRAAKLGTAIAEAGEGASLLARAGRAAAGYGTEGIIQGAGQGVTELALSDQPLDAERIAGVLSSHALLGGGIGAGVGAGGSVVGSVAGRALSRASRALDEVGAARKALSEVPEDLAQLDVAGLRKAAQEERVALKAQAQAEKEALQAERVPLRKQAAADVEEIHRVLQDDAPIFAAVQGPDVESIAGVKDIRVQLAKSWKGMRREFDNPIAIADNPERLVGHLQMRQVALEQLQRVTPDLRATLKDGARGDALYLVDDALEMTREQISRIQSLSKWNPVSSAKLTALDSGVSQRLQAIEAAQEALKNAPELGLIGRGAKEAAFGAVTSLAHAIPGVGILAPFVGRWASDGIGKLFEHFSGARNAVAANTKKAIDKFLTVGKAAAGPVTSTASAVLRTAKFGDGPEPKSDSLRDVFQTRTAELRNQTMYDPTGNVVIRPEARQAIARKLAPVAQVNPLLADKLETVAVRKLEFLSAMMPRRPDIGGLQIGPDDWAPSSLQMRSWARTVRAVEDPASVEEDLANGVMTPEGAVAYRSVYPERFAALRDEVFRTAPTLSRTLPMQKKVALSIFTGVPVMASMQPNILAVLQGAYAVEPEAPKPNPSFGALGSARSPDKQMTKSQQNEGA